MTAFIDGTPIYLDHNATTQPDPAVLADMIPCLEGVYGNPSSTHGFGQEARRVVDLARQRVASLIGALYHRQGQEPAPFLLGGSHERQQRAGTENVPGIAGFGKACVLAKDRLTESSERLRALSSRLERGIVERIPGARIHGHPMDRLPNTVSVGFAGINGEHLAVSLDILGIAVATTAACSSSRKTPSHVLLAMGCTPEEATAAIRISLGAENTEDQIDHTIAVLAETVRRLSKKG